METDIELPTNYDYKLYTNYYVRTWRYRENGTLQAYEKANSTRQSHSLYVEYHKNGQLSHYRPCKYGKNNIVMIISWDTDGNLTEKYKYVNGAEVE